MELGQTLRQSLSQKLSPKMIQSMEILQLPITALEERIHQELERNPLLERVEATPDESRDARVRERTIDSEPPPVVELGSGRAGDPGTPADNREARYNELPDGWRDYMENWGRGGRLGDGEWRARRFDDGQRDAKLEAMNNTAARPAGLVESLTEQLAFVEAQGVTRSLARAIIEHLEDTGHLRVPLEEIAVTAGLSGATAAQCQAALELVQSLDPPGVGARDLRECLLLQIDRLLVERGIDPRRIGPLKPAAGPTNPSASMGPVVAGSSATPVRIQQAGMVAARRNGDLTPAGGTLLPGDRIRPASSPADRPARHGPAEPPTLDDLIMARRIVAEHFEDLLHNRWPAITRVMGIPMGAIEGAVRWLRKLSPRPGTIFEAAGAPPVMPDVIIDYDPDTDSHTVRAADDHRGLNLAINEDYRQLLSNGTDATTKGFIRENIRSANWLINSLAQRRATLLRVAQQAVEHQREFLLHGPSALRPLPMTQVADELGIHVATVSRAVSEKYALTPRGLLPLRSFFTGGTQSADGQDIAWDAVRAKLVAIVAAEDKANPLSDDQIVATFASQGIELARRTVAKYRKILNIPSARQRRRFDTTAPAMLAPALGA